MKRTVVLLLVLELALAGCSQDFSKPNDRIVTTTQAETESTAAPIATPINREQAIQLVEKSLLKAYVNPDFFVYDLGVKDEQADWVDHAELSHPEKYYYVIVSPTREEDGARGGYFYVNKYTGTVYIEVFSTDKSGNVSKKLEETSSTRSTTRLSTRTTAAKTRLRRTG